MQPRRGRPTTSFLDQDHSASARKKKAAYAQAASIQKAQDSKRTPITAPPKPASAETKARLGAFAFRPSTTNSNKDSEETMETKKDYGLPVVDEENESFSKLIGIPKTPAHRQPLKEPSSNDEDDESPMPFRHSEIPAEERIAWQPSPRSTPYPSARKGSQRRAMSSSPIGSPRMHATPAPSRQPLDMNTLARNLKTPTADPATDLWTRYSSAGIETSPSIAQFLKAAPSQVAGNGSPRGNLKRAYTDDWPRFKKRKLDPSKKNSEDTDMADLPKPKSGKAKLARVSRLVDKMHATLSRPNNENISSSSPLPCRTDYDPPSSPTSRIALPRSPFRQPPPPLGFDFKGSPRSSPLRQQPQLPPPQINSEDYFDDDDDDVDMDMYEKVEQEAIQQSQMLAARSAPNSDIPSALQSKAPSEPHSPAAMLDDDDDDEYGADDDFGADLEQLLSKYESVEGTANAAPEASAAAVADDGDDDEFGDDDFDDLDEEELKLASALIVDKASKVEDKRYKVKSVSLSDCQREKDLLVFDKTTGAETHIYLQDAWAMTEVSEDDYVRVIGKPSEWGSWVVNNRDGLLILHPDILISSTTVADSFQCIRKAVLADRVKSTNDTNEYMIYGKLLHEIFQEALSTNDFSTASLTVFIDKVVTKFMDEFYLINTDLDGAKTHLKAKIPLIQRFSETLIGARPKNGVEIIDHRGGDKPKFAINKLLDIEEHVWAPKYGLKGNIDATVQIAMTDAEGSRTLTVPFELKTGRNSSAIAHRAQTMLYTLLLSERYDINIYEGILHYLEAGDTIRVKAMKDELRGILIQRNELADYIKKKSGAPMLGRPRDCKNCHAQTACFVYHSAVEDGTPETSKVDKLFEEATAHILPSGKEFFKHWDYLLTKEEKDLSRFRREMWLMTSEAREEKGRCLGQLNIVPGTTGDTGSDKINRYHYVFRRSPTATGTHPFTDSQIIAGEPIMISSEGGHLALAKGYAISVSRNSITVGVDRRLHNTRTRQEGFNEINNQVFNGTVDYVSKQVSSSREANSEVLYRIDKDEFANGFAMVRQNLVQLLTKEHKRLASMIIDLENPSFKVTPTAYTIENASSLNDDQKNAIEKVMSAKDYALILGMPGTGKTTTIAEIIKALVSQGKSVLLTSYTHTAVDNILLKIRDVKTGILRLGNSMKIHPEVKVFALLQETKYTNMDELRKKYEGPQIVATTCLGINHPLFRKRQFDYCIVDEASQITLPVCLGPIRFAKTFVLVGDHYQLPPLVRDAEAKAGGLDISLFKRLSDAHPEAQINLAHQYRMSEDIMLLSNNLIYKGLLKCGTEKVANQVLRIPNKRGFYKYDRSTDCGGGLQCWLNDILDEDVKACFLNTDVCPAFEERTLGDNVQNPTEAVLVRQIISSLLSASISPDSIGVISIYRSQLKVMNQELRQHIPLSMLSSIEMHTADKYQGRDKDLIIISLARSNDHNSVGELLKDWRRINVAFTRAKKKLIIIGSKSTIAGGSPLLNEFVQLMESKQWIIDLPANAHLLHNPRPNSSFYSMASLSAPTLALAGAAMAVGQPLPVGEVERVSQKEKENKGPVRRISGGAQTSQSAAENKKEKSRRNSPVMKVPDKCGQTTAGAMLNGRPVLRNIVNDIL